MYFDNAVAEPRALRARTAPRKFDFHSRGSAQIPRGTDPRGLASAVTPLLCIKRILVVMKHTFVIFRKLSNVANFEEMFR